MKVSAIIITLMLPVLSWPSAESIAACKDKTRYSTRRSQGECLKKTDDANAIPEIHKLMREIVAERGERSLADGDFSYLSRFAGDLSAWTDHRFLIEKTRSPDRFDRVFAVEALRSMLLGLSIRERGTVPERIERFEAVREDAARACKPFINSSDEVLSGEAKVCLDAANGKGPDYTPLPKPEQPEPSICLRDAFARSIELCLIVFRDGYVFKGRRHFGAVKKEWVKEPEPGVRWTDQSQIALAVQGHHQPMGQTWVDQLEPGEGVVPEDISIHPLKNGLMLMVVPLARDYQRSLLTRRVFMATYWVKADPNDCGFVDKWLSPVCSDGCKAPSVRIHRNKAENDGEIELSLASARGAKHRYRLAVVSDGGLVHGLIRPMDK